MNKYPVSITWESFELLEHEEADHFTYSNFHLGLAFQFNVVHLDSSCCWSV